MAFVDVQSEVTGTVWKLEAQVGQVLEEDDAILIIESMKMEIPVYAPEHGTVVEVLVTESDMIQEGQVVARMETE